jgi:CTP synthase (UTP-ammonia lyase)
MATKVRIGIIGDYNPDNPTHLATNEGIQHAAEILTECTFESSWLPTDQRHQFGEYQGLLCSPGSPYRSLESALLGIKCAREQMIPFLGTCGVRSIWCWNMREMRWEFARPHTQSLTRTRPACSSLR